MNSQQEIMSVCLAVVRGRITPEQARAAILARTSPEPLAETLHLDPEIIREAEQLARLPEKDREECLELFKELYDSTPGEKVFEEDGALGRMLVEQHIVPQSQIDECIAIQRRLHKAACSPLPRLGELLLRQGYLVPGRMDQAPTRKAPTTRAGTGAGPSDLPERPSPDSVRKALADPAQRFGRYVRVSLLGQGGAGEVWKSWDMALERWVALKFLKFEDTEELARLRREAQTAARLSHPNIAAVFEMAEANGRSFLVMEFIDGQTLSTYPRHDHRKLVSMMRDVAQAIQYAHDQGVIHRDIKPGNIMVDTSGRAYIMDFGLARHISSDRTTGEHILGTPSYMSPEQAKGGAVDARCDVYALGATLYELLSDRPPFRGRNALETLEQVIRDEPAPLDRIGSDLRTIVFKCLEKEPAGRYLRAAEVAEDLRRWQEGEAIIAHPPSVLYRLRKKMAKRQAVLIVGLVGLLVSAAVAGWAFRAGRELTVEKESRAAEAQALTLARPHLEKGRQTRSRLDRVLMADDMTDEAVRKLTEEAHRDFDRALELFPAYPDALLEKGRLYRVEKDHPRALEYYTRAIEAAKGYTTAHLLRVRIQLEMYEDLRHRNEPPSGPEMATLAAQIRADARSVDAGSKDTKELLFASAAMAIVDGEFEKAARIFEEYSRASVTSYRGWEWAGHAWLHVPGMLEKANQAFTEATKVRPRYASAWVLRGKAWLESARRQGAQGDAARSRAMADFRHALELEPSDIDAHLGLGETLLLTGDPAGAMSSFTKAVDGSPGASAPLVARAWAKLRTRDNEGALADAQEALRRGSRDPAAKVAQARARCASGDIGGAQDDVEEVAAKHPRYAPAYVALGDVLRERGNPEGAIVEYSRAITLDPGLAEAYHHRGIAERDRGRLEKALEDLTQAVSLDSTDPYLYFDRGVCRSNQGAWSQAQEDFRQGLALRPTRADWFWQRLWVARTKMGEPAQALEELKAFVQGRPEGAAGRLAPKMNDLLLGRLSEEEFLALLERTEFSRKAIAEGYYLAGEKALAEGRRARAAELLQRCLRTGARTTSGYSSAEITLRSIPGSK